MSASIVRRLVLCAVLLVAAPASAQFDQFSWTFDPGSAGSGSVTAEKMVIVGPDSGPFACGDTTTFLAIAPYDLVLVVDYSVDNNDKAGPGADWLVSILDGGATYLSGQCSGCQLVMQVPAGSSFGFGVSSADCIFGEAVATLTNLVVQPAPQVLGAAGTAAGSQFGTALAAFGDVNGDGAPEIAVGAPGFAAEAGRVTVHDGSNFAVVRVFNGAAAGDRLGYALSGAGDQDGDGVGDLLVGVPRADLGAPNTGAARLYSGSTAALLALLPGSAGGNEFGRALADAGDLDGDGLHDLLVAAPRHDGVGADSGEVVAFSGGAYGQLLAFDGAAAGDQFGSALAGVGDLDGDGVPDIAIGAPFADVLAADSGRAQLFSGATAALLHELLPQACNGDAGDAFGSAVAGVGDVDGDGTPDVAVGVPGDSCTGNLLSGALRVYSGADGHLLNTVFGANTAERLGSSVAGLGDANGDGELDLLVGSPGNQLIPPQTGHAQILSGDDTSLLVGFDGTEPDDAFGLAVAAPGDTNGDGLPEALVGAPAPFTLQAGAAQLLRPAFLWTDLGHGLAGTAGTPTLAGTGLLAPNTPLSLTLDHVGTGLPVTIVVGLRALELPFKGGVLVPAPDVVLGGLVSSGPQLILGHVFPPGVPSGTELFLQMWLADPAGPKGLAASNGLRGAIP